MKQSTIIKTPVLVGRILYIHAYSVCVSMRQLETIVSWNPFIVFIISLTKINIGYVEQIWFLYLCLTYYYYYYYYY